MVSDVRGYMLVMRVRRSQIRIVRVGKVVVPIQSFRPPINFVAVRCD